MGDCGLHGVQICHAMFRGEDGLRLDDSFPTKCYSVLGKIWLGEKQHAYLEVVADNSKEANACYCFYQFQLTRRDGSQCS